MFRRVVDRATSRGMLVNSGKTKVLCISDAQTYKAVSFLLDSDSQRLESGKTLKVLGFHFDSRPTVHTHVEALKKNVRKSLGVKASWICRL